MHSCSRPINGWMTVQAPYDGQTVTDTQHTIIRGLSIATMER